MSHDVYMLDIDITCSSAVAVQYSVVQCLMAVAVANCENAEQCFELPEQQPLPCMCCVSAERCNRGGPVCLPE